MTPTTAKQIIESRNEISEETLATLCVELNIEDNDYQACAEQIAYAAGYQVLASSDPSNDLEYNVLYQAYASYRERKYEGGEDPLPSWKLLAKMDGVTSVSFENLNTFGHNEPCTVYLTQDVTSVLSQVASAL